MAVTFVSLGPGDPELVTLGALRVLREADRVVCPSSGGTSRAAAIVRTLGIAPDRIRLVDVPMSVDRRAATEAYLSAAGDIADAHRSGERVAVAAEGDTGFYATVDYMADALVARGITPARVAGVPAFLACAALGGISLARQNGGVEVVPGTLTAGGLAEKLAAGRTVVVMKASRCEAEIKLAIGQLPGASFHYFENVGTPGAEFHTDRRDEILARQFPYFSLVIIR